ncbi:putative Zn finger protein [Streptosporangium album]|uniref:Putative Zn finger protein n=1 Tax=Streptosporangium album TaxID=47479 RepID=A0A7W7RVK8_9ACTN|nr:hypothetical protein [Streptosporangium album]MBB4939049.1 putative Zn finger protein [Streptosporangium album]
MGTIAELVGPEMGRAARAAVTRGDELERSGAVQLVRFSPSLVTAEVDDGAAHVELRAVDGVMHWRCTCAEGRDGAFCAHCVATVRSLTRRGEERASRRGPVRAVDDIV